MTSHTAGSQHCAHCGKKGEGVRLKQCASCKKILYCSKPCQSDHWIEHRKECPLPSCMTVNTTPRKQRQIKVALLVGKKYLIDCYIQGQSVQALWDSGSQVTIVDELWKDMHLSDTKLRGISEILDTADTLEIVAANGENMPYAGWVEVTFRLASRGAPTTEVIVPTLVMMGSKLTQPIIGSNVIGLILDGERKQSNSPDRKWLDDTVRAVFPTLEPSQAQAFIEQISAEQPSSEYVVKTKEGRISVPKHMSVQVECCVHMQPPDENSTLIFEPDVNCRWTEGLEFCDTLVEVIKGSKPSITVSVQNSTDHEIVLAGRTVIGTVQHIQAVYPVSILEGSRPSPPARVNNIRGRETN